MQNSSSDVLVIGAGMAGLAAARTIAKTGLSVIVVDKGRGVGGRMCSRRITLADGREARIDHGAQFFTAKGLRFRREVAAWLRAGHVKRWYRNSVHHDNATRFCGLPTMSAVPTRMADGLDVRLGCSVTAVQACEGGWSIVMNDGSMLSSSGLVVTAPLPQAVTLLRAVLPGDSKWGVLAVDEDPVFAPCLAAIFCLERPSGMVFPGCAQIPGSNLNWICDNQVKGVSTDIPCLTVHASASFSARWWTEDRERLKLEITEEVRQRLHVDILQSDFHGWRYSFARRTLPGVFGIVQQRPPLVLAGDAFVSPKVEGAFESGTEAGRYVAEALALLFARK